MVTLQETSGAAATLATSSIPDPTGYGRIVRDSHKRFAEIVEHKNATPRQLEIHEVYPSYAVFDATALWSCLDDLQPNSLTNEYYLTEIPQMLLERGLGVEIVNAVAPEDILSINTPEQLEDVESVLLDRLQNKMEPTT
jgi:bifunctional UDP-N-acetylglucosamine pyrophosphorylase/glucosamine-1-phosphate N-acetyltransferase